MNNVRITKKAFNSITDYVRFNYIEPQYQLFGTRTKLEDLNPTIIEGNFDNYSQKSIIAIGNQELFNRTSIIELPELSDEVSYAFAIDFGNRKMAIDYKNCSYCFSPFATRIDGVEKTSSGTYLPILLNLPSGDRHCYNLHSRAYFSKFYYSDLSNVNYNMFTYWNPGLSEQDDNYYVKCGTSFNGLWHLQTRLLDKGYQLRLFGIHSSLDISSLTYSRDNLLWIFNHLEAITTTNTLTIGSTNLALLTDEDKKIATDKGWTLA